MRRRSAVLLCAAPLLALAIATLVPHAGASVDAPAPRQTAAAVNNAEVRPVLLTGEVEALGAQTIFVPPSNSSPVILRNFVAEGSHVKTGDVVLRIDVAGAANVDTLKADRARVSAHADSETATLDVTAVGAEKALVSAKAALDKAKVDAALPKGAITALAFDQYRAELDRATRDLVIKQDGWQNALRAASRRKEDGALEIRKLQINEAYQLAQMAEAEVRATQDGVVVHGYSALNGERLDEGAPAWPGNAAGAVQGDGRMGVTAWVLEADRPYLREAQTVSLRFDALPAAAIEGKIASITSAPEARPRWGLGRYFRVKIALPEHHGLPLVSGMSVLVMPTAPTVATARQAPAASADLSIEGEIASRKTMPVAPPSIRYVWQYKLAMLAPEGMMIEAGQPIAVFESEDVRKQLAERQSTLRERERALAKLVLDQVEADRSGVLAQAEALSNADKAERKAGQPKDLIRRVDYDKLVIERTEKAQLAKLAQSQYAAERRARIAERAGLESEITQLRSLIAALLKGQAALTVSAPQRGLVLYRRSFNGDKFSTGSQVWMGMSVATLADPDQLCVDAKLPEAQASSVRVGQAARVTVTGARQSLSAHVTTLGNAFHSKSAAQASVVRDIQLQFDTPPKDLKPGAAVQVALLRSPNPSTPR